jgi:Uma2 family endonuclease
MSELAIRPWTVDEFFTWQERQEKRYELVGGFPLEMMTGASNRHDDIVVNILLALGEKLRGKPCRPFTADGSVQTLPGQIRRPDLGVDCGTRDPAGYAAAQPVVLFEVMSPSTRNFDRYRKIHEYQGVALVRHIAFVEPSRPMVRLWSRETNWREHFVEGLDAGVPLEAIGIMLEMTAIYDGIAF